MTDSKWDFRPELLSLYRDTGHELIGLHRPSDVSPDGKPLGKAPYKGWRTARPLTVDEAREHMMMGGNVGCRMRDIDLVVDVDPRNFEEGDDPYRRLQEDLGVDFAMYPSVVTGSGGFHVYMLKPADALLRDTLEAYQGVEFKTLGRQVVAPGSVHPGQKAEDGVTWVLEPGGVYQWTDDFLAPLLKDVREAPRALIELARRPGRIAAVDAGTHDPEELELMLEALDPLAYNKDHSKWLDLMMACHHATAGEGREEFIAWSTRDPLYSGHGWMIGRRWDTLKTDGERRVTQRTLYKALVDAGRVDLLPRTSAEDDFADDLSEVSGEESEDELSHIQEGDPSFGPLEAMNAKGYCAVNENGQFRIYKPVMDYAWDPLNPRERWETYRKTDFLDILSNVRTQTSDGKVVPVGQQWLQWGMRTTYDGVAFDPANRIPKEARVLNLWTDWAVEPKRGDWSLMKELLLEALCDGDKEAYEYALNWAAFMVQQPDRPAEVALVFKGEKGTGKGTFGRALAMMAGRHAMHISNQSHFTNHFNAHLRDCILLFADEAVWGGDVKAEGELKRLITEPTIQIEAKGKDVVTARNMLHVVMASNGDWVVPASMDDERRFAVNEVNSKYRGNKAFFEALHRQLNRGGLQAMLFDLKTRPIGDFHPRAGIPQTMALAKQKLTSLDHTDSWWYECLCRGHLGGDWTPVVGAWDTQDPTSRCVYLTDDLKASLEDHLQRSGDRHRGRRATETMLGERLRKRIPAGMRHVRLKVPSERFDVRTSSDGRAYGYELPSLSECRAQFETQLGSKLPWAIDAEVIDPELDVVEL